MIRHWSKVFQMHKATPPRWDKFLELFGAYQEPRDDAPGSIPNGAQLHARAQKAKEDTAAGSDGWKPNELKALPVAAWNHRAQFLKECTAGQIPHALPYRDCT